MPTTNATRARTRRTQAPDSIGLLIAVATRPESPWHELTIDPWCSAFARDAAINLKVARKKPGSPAIELVTHGAFRLGLAAASQAAVEKHRESRFVSAAKGEPLSERLARIGYLLEAFENVGSLVSVRRLLLKAARNGKAASQFIAKHS